MKKTNTNTTATMNTTTTNTTTKEGAENMKKNEIIDAIKAIDPAQKGLAKKKVDDLRAILQDLQSKSAPADQTAPQETPQESKPQETPQTAAQDKPAKKDDKTTVIIPKLSRAIIPATETDPEREGYTLKFSEKKTRFTRVSIPGQELTDRVQLALAAECRAAVLAELASVNAIRVDAEATPEERKTADLQAADLRAIQKKLAETFPGVDEYERGAADNTHARLLACALGGYYLPLTLEAWETAAAATFAALRGSLQTKLEEHGAAAFTDGERANISALKAHTVKAFEKYSAETTISKAFRLRVKDCDILDWFQMSLRGYKGESGEYKPAARLGMKGQNGYRRILVSFFLGAILRDGDEAEKPADK